MNKSFLTREAIRLSSSHYYTGRSSTLSLINNLLRFFMYLRSPKPHKSTLIATRIKRDSEKGKRALVLGNGPSLDKLIPENLSEYFDSVFVVNGFYQLKISDRIKPTFYCLSDPLDLIGLLDEASEFSVNFKNFMSKNEGCIGLLPHHFGKALDHFFSEVIRFDDRERTLFFRSIKLTKPRGYTSVTTYKSLAAACYLGFSEIYILGIDNTEFKDYVGNPTNVLTFKDTTYAQSKSGKMRSLRNTIKIDTIYVSGMAGRMQSYARLFGDLRLFSRYPVFNLDPYSLVDAFPKIENHPAIDNKLPD
jgi:hypothetical protein